MADPFEKINNFLSNDVTKKPFNSQTATQEDLLKELAKSHYQRDSLTGTTYFQGVIGEVLQKVNNDETAWLKYAVPSSSDYKRYRVYIKELHGGTGRAEFLERPKSAKDKEKIKEYALNKLKLQTLPVVENFFPGSPDYNVGDVVWVFFQSSQTQENGLILGKVNKQSVVSSTETKISGLRAKQASNGVDSPVPSTPPTQNQNETIYPSPIDTDVEDPGIVAPPDEYLFENPPPLRPPIVEDTAEPDEPEEEEEEEEEEEPAEEPAEETPTAPATTPSETPRQEAVQPTIPTPPVVSIPPATPTTPTGSTPAPPIQTTPPNTAPADLLNINIRSPNLTETVDVPAPKSPTEVIQTAKETTVVIPPRETKDRKKADSEDEHDLQILERLGDAEKRASEESSRREDEREAARKAEEKQNKQKEKESEQTDKSAESKVPGKTGNKGIQPPSTGAPPPIINKDGKEITVPASKSATKGKAGTENKGRDSGDKKGSETKTSYKETPTDRNKKQEESASKTKPADSSPDKSKAGSDEKTSVQTSPGQQAINLLPPGMKDAGYRYIFKYCDIIHAMIKTKGIQYRCHLLMGALLNGDSSINYYNSLGQKKTINNNEDLKKKIISLDRNKKGYLTGISDINSIVSIEGKNGLDSREFITSFYSYISTINVNFEATKKKEIEVGKQLPGDICHIKFNSRFKKEDDEEWFIVVSYPDRKKWNHSIIWGPTNTDIYTDQYIPYSYVGSSMFALNKDLSKSTETQTYQETVYNTSYYPGIYYDNNAGYYRAWYYDGTTSTVEKKREIGFSYENFQPLNANDYRLSYHAAFQPDPVVKYYRPSLSTSNEDLANRIKFNGKTPGDGEKDSEIIKNYLKRENDRNIDRIYNPSSDFSTFSNEFNSSPAKDRELRAEMQEKIQQIIKSDGSIADIDKLDYNGINSPYLKTIRLINMYKIGKLTKKITDI